LNGLVQFRSAIVIVAAAYTETYASLCAASSNLDV
jgi:hypothetical protein